MRVVYFFTDMNTLEIVCLRVVYLNWLLLLSSRTTQTFMGDN